MPDRNPRPLVVYDDIISHTHIWHTLISAKYNFTILKHAVIKARYNYITKNTLAIDENITAYKEQTNPILKINIDIAEILLQIKVSMQ